VVHNVLLLYNYTSLPCQYRSDYVVSIGGIVVIVRVTDFIELRHQDGRKPWPRGLANASAIAGLLPLPEAFAQYSTPTLKTVTSQRGIQVLYSSPGPLNWEFANGGGRVTV
jgi:hypothetical protein